MIRAARTQDEIVARIASIGPDDDWMGTRRETLVGYLDFEHVRPYLKPGTTAEQWTPDVDPPIGAAHGYLAFAIGKAAGHRGLSTMRSIDHYREWAWLSGDQFFMAALELDYPSYGAPILRAIADAIGATDIWRAHSTAELERMATGLPCEPGCTGCLG